MKEVFHKHEINGLKILGYTNREIREARKLVRNWRKANTALMDFTESMAVKISTRPVPIKFRGKVTPGEFKLNKIGGPNRFNVKF